MHALASMQSASAYRIVALSASAKAHLPTLRATVPLGCTSTLFTLPLCPSIVLRQSQLPACRHGHILTFCASALPTPRSMLLHSMPPYVFEAESCLVVVSSRGLPATH